MQYLDWVAALGKSRVYVRVAGFQGRAWVRWLREERGVVPVGKTALRFLESYLRGVRPYLVRGAEVALWVGRDGKRMSYPALWRRVRRYGRQEDFGVTVTPHTFRRSCTTELIRAGTNLWHVKELLGHENMDTLQHYARLTITD